MEGLPITALEMDWLAVSSIRALLWQPGELPNLRVTHIVFSRSQQTINNKLPFDTKPRLLAFFAPGGNSPGSRWGPGSLADTVPPTPLCLSPASPSRLFLIRPICAKKKKKQTYTVLHSQKWHKSKHSISTSMRKYVLSSKESGHKFLNTVCFYLAIPRIF